MLVGVVVDDTAYSGRVDFSQHALEFVVVDENPCRVLGFQRLRQLLIRREIVERDEVLCLDVRMVADCQELCPKPDVCGWNIRYGYAERGERVARREAGADVGIKEGSSEGVEVCGLVADDEGELLRLVYCGVEGCIGVGEEGAEGVARERHWIVLHG